MAIQGAVPVLTVNAMLEGMRVVGLDVERLLRVTRLQSLAGRAPDAPVADAEYVSIWREARRITSMDAIGALCGASVPEGGLGALDYLTSSAANVAEALVCARDYVHLTTLSAYLELEQHANGALDLSLINLQRGEEDDTGDEFVMGLLLGRVTRLAVVPIRVSEVQLVRRKPSLSITEKLGGRVSYGNARSRIVWAPCAGSTAMRSANPGLHATLKHLLQAAGQCPAQHGCVTGVARQCIRSLLAEQRSPTLALVAQNLGSSPRTLQRRLKEAGARYEQIVDELRCEAASRLLQADDNRSVLSVGLELGFADERAFARAFRRWTGQAPSQWRKRNPGRRNSS